jgi:DNA-binding NtrC family response regulator
MTGPTTLIVDDEVMVRQLLRRILEPDVCNVLDAENGEAALRLIQRRRDSIDVVLTDLVMPGIDGFDVLEVLTEYHPDLPVVCMTGYASSLGEHRRRLPARILAKPFTAEGVLGLIGPLLEQNRTLKRAAREQQEEAITQVAASNALRVRGEMSVAHAVDLIAAARSLRARRTETDPVR